MILKIDEEFKSLIPPLSTEEFEQLEKNILVEGIREPIIIWRNEKICCENMIWNDLDERICINCNQSYSVDEIIIDGHNRYEIAMKHGLKYETFGKGFNSRQEVLEWMILNQFGRRNLSAYQRSLLALKLKPVFEEKAKEKQGARNDIPKKSEESEIKFLKKVEEIKKMGLSFEAEKENIRIAELNKQKEKKRYNDIQNTKIYIAQSENKIKVGISIYPEERINQLKTGNSEIKLVNEYNFGDKSREIEKNTHKYFAKYSNGGEWFVGNEDLLNKINQYIKKEYSRLSETNVILSKVAGVSHDTIAKVQKIEEKAPEKIKEQLQKGDISINQAYQATRRQEKIEEIEEKVIPKDAGSKSIDIYNTNNKYSIIYADPAWSYFESGNKNQSLHYNTMTIDDICKIPVKNIADDNCILFIWVTFPILQESFKVIESWGFKYSTCGFNWIKKNKVSGTNFFGCGSWTRANSELCLIATKGSIMRLDNTISQVIETPIEEHSKKPQIVRELITRLVGELPRIELFSRNNTNGWDSWGDMI